MAASTITRVTWTDGAGGTVINNAVKNSDIYDKVDQMFAGAGSYTTFEFGGKVKIDGAGLTVVGNAAPSVSSAGQGVVYFDSTANRFMWSENGGSYRPFGTVPYTATLTDVVNTTTRTAAIAFTVGANEMNDGDAIEVIAAVLVKNNSGGTPTVLLEWFWGATGIAINGTGTAWTNNANEIKQLLQFRLQRVGSDLWVRAQDPNNRVDLQLATNDLTSGNTNVASMTPTFTASASVELRVTLSTANANFYLKVQKARILRQQAA